MRRIDARTVELTPPELLVSEIVDLLLDQGYTQSDAVILLRGARVPDELRRPSPNLDACLTPDFVEYLTS